MSLRAISREMGIPYNNVRNWCMGVNMGTVGYAPLLKPKEAESLHQYIVAKSEKMEGIRNDKELCEDVGLFLEKSTRKQKKRMKHGKPSKCNFFRL